MPVSKPVSTSPTYTISQLLLKRSDFGLVCDLFGYRVGVEIGVDRGTFSYQLLSNSTYTFFYFVDPWMPYAEINHERREAEEAARLEISKFPERSAIIKCSSLEAAGAIPAPIDFVYIDGAHDYYNVKTDIKVWWSRLTSKGMLAGHDFDLKSVQNVLQEEFAGRIVYIVPERPDTNTGAHPSWYVFKE